ncbi:hypothetical protein EDC01DRAFT_781454 [Geopyxis carbonaria]|nr:hypothetical protein EDC01DRAFT_781454 [Geopyxis carbonaria]
MAVTSIIWEHCVGDACRLEGKQRWWDCKHCGTAIKYQGGGIIRHLRNHHGIVRPGDRRPEVLLGEEILPASAVAAAPPPAVETAAEAVAQPPPAKVVKAGRVRPTATTKAATTTKAPVKVRARGRGARAQKSPIGLRAQVELQRARKDAHNVRAAKKLACEKRRVVKLYRTLEFCQGRFDAILEENRKLRNTFEDLEEVVRLKNTEIELERKLRLEFD